ncbi:ATP-grasp domain-containing protein [Bacteroides sp.]|uniref:carboxylate--amine ligase n=1 Tax=Bacteroides sp. TaxID=29523 RepID=UPI003AB516BD
MKEKIRVLLLDGHTIQALPFIEAFNKLKTETTIFCETKLSYGYFSIYKKHSVICPKLKNNKDAYLAFLISYLKANPQDLIIPLFNDTAELASKYKNELEAWGCKVEVPEWNIFIKAHDKESLMYICEELCIPHPRTANPAKVGYKKAIEYVKYPCLIKPNLSAGAKGIKMLHNKESFDINYQATISQFGESTIQEYIPQTGKQLKVQIYRSENGNIVASSCYEKCRYYPIDGGTSTCNKIISRPDLVEQYKKILDYINWAGIADFDCIEDPRNGEILLMEINPRVPGTIKASFLAGINIAEIMICHAKDLPYKEYKYKENFYLRNLATEIVWFLSSKERFRSKPNWFRFSGSEMYYVDGSWKDPLPFLGGFIGGLSKLLDPEFRKAKRK